MNYGLIMIVAAAILSGCCRCPKPCPWLVGKPEGTECPEGGFFCECVPTSAPIAEPPPPPPPPPAPVSVVVKDNRFVFDGFQAQSVAVQDVRCSKTRDGFEKVQVFVKNLTTDPIRTRYRFNWQDANGVEVVDPDHDGWEKETLIPGDEGVFTSIAPRKDCVDFKMRMSTVR